MARKVIWANAAVSDLDAAADYISNDSPAYAASFVLKTLKSARSLGDLSERGRVVPEFKREDIREIFVFNYRLVYRIEKIGCQMGLITNQQENRLALLIANF